MVDYDSRPVVVELLCNRFLANLSHCGDILRLKQNLELWVWEDLPYSLSFLFDFGDVFLVSLEGKDD